MDAPKNAGLPDRRKSSFGPSWDSLLMAHSSAMVRAHAPRLDVRGSSAARQGTPGVSDADLALRAKGGDRWAEEALFHRYFDYISALAYRLLRDRMEGEDVVQDTFLDAFAQLRAGSVPS